MKSTGNGSCNGFMKCSLVGRYLVVSGFLANQRSGNKKPFLFVSIYLVLTCLCFPRKWYPLRQLKYYENEETDQKSGRSFDVATDGLHNAHRVVSKFEKLWEQIVFAGKEPRPFIPIKFG